MPLSRDLFNLYGLFSSPSDGHIAEFTHLCPKEKWSQYNMKDFDVDTFKPLYVPYWFTAYLGPFYIFLLRQFFLTIPSELNDAARIDGYFYYFRRTYSSIIFSLSEVFCGRNFYKWGKKIDDLPTLNKMKRGYGC